MSLNFPSLLQHEQAREALAHLTRQLQAGARQSASLAALQDFDSSALSVMLALLRVARAQSGDLIWHDVPPRIRSLAQVYGVDSVLGLDAPGH